MRSEGDRLYRSPAVDYLPHVVAEGNRHYLRYHVPSPEEGISEGLVSLYLAVDYRGDSVFKACVNIYQGHLGLPRLVAMWVLRLDPLDDDYVWRVVDLAVTRRGEVPGVQDVSKDYYTLSACVVARRSRSVPRRRAYRR
jgi:hypothetical protein